jgi:phosphate transport system substrate-binding protein
MAQRSGPPPIVFILLLLGLLGGGYWFFIGSKQNQTANLPNSTPQNPTTQINPTDTTNTTSTAPAAFPAPTTVAGGTTVRIDGSTSMVTINENLKRAFQSQFANTSVVTNAKGTDAGIQALLAGTVDVAAISRPLTAQEQAQGLVAVPVASDAIAIIIGTGNPFNGNLTAAQVSDIFQGKINNWSAIGGSPANIRVINRPAVSGTHQAFKDLVLKGANFGTTPNVTTLPKDATTPLIQALGNDGIGYATYTQAKKQSTARALPIDGLMPDSPAYPYKRQLFYVYKTSSPAVQAFFGYVGSPSGQQAIAAAES